MFCYFKMVAQSLSTAPVSGNWNGWYVQTAYRFPETNWEAVACYGEYDTPIASKDVNQTTLGINYLLASNLLAKLDYEFNDNPNTGLTAANRLLVQLAYGF